MSGFFNKRIGSWAVSLLESTVFGFFSKVRENTIEILEELPENSSRFLYTICFLLFAVVTAAVGAVLFSASIIIIVVQSFGPNINKILYAGMAFSFLGLFYLIVSVVLINIIGKNLKVSTEKTTRKLVRKLEK